MSNELKVTFTETELNKILKILGEAPAKYVIEVINFIQDKAKEQPVIIDEPIIEVEE